MTVTTEEQIQHFVDQPWVISGGRTRERMVEDARRWFNVQPEVPTAD